MAITFVFLGLLPSLIWLSLFLQEDIHPEPRREIFYVFLTGVAAALAALLAEIYLNKFYGNGLSAAFFSGNSPENLSPILIFAVIEEAAKWLAVFLTIARTAYFDEPIDAMIYMITAAAGFAAAENVSTMMQDFSLGYKMDILISRFLGATVLHAFSSALLGYYWAKGIIRKQTAIFIVIGLAAASVLHAVFNYLIIVHKGVIIYPLILLFLVSFFIFYDFEKIKREEERLTSASNAKELKK